jgi:hypothetical protein
MKEVLKKKKCIIVVVEYVFRACVLNCSVTGRCVNKPDHLFVEHAIMTGCRQPFFQINTKGIKVCLIIEVCCNINNPTSS